jgi:hypothetical protein
MSNGSCRDVLRRRPAGSFHKLKQEYQMPLRFSALIKLKNGNQQRVEIVANTWLNARMMIESQYGKGVIISGPDQSAR